MTNILGTIGHMGMNSPAPVDTLMEMQRWANSGIAQQRLTEQQPCLPWLQSPWWNNAPQHPLERGWSQHHLDALLDVELGL